MDARVEEEADVKRKERADMLEKGRQLAEDPKAARERLFFGAPLGQFASKMAVDETAHAQHAHSEEMLQEDTNSTSEGAAATKRPLFVAASQQSQEIPLSNAWTQMTMEEKQRALNDLDTEGVMNEDGSYAGLGYTSGRRGLGYTGT
ncbi:unnamed protein product [Amoebophrya sp. A25]|nr:unnamed protein product [Amoebophrya sp. A25]|eukprot:GSA25T00014207001.1